MHGKSVQDITKKQGINKLINDGLFQNIVILSNRNGPGTIEKIYKYENDKLEVC